MYLLVPQLNHGEQLPTVYMKTLSCLHHRDDDDLPCSNPCTSWSREVNYGCLSLAAGIAPKLTALFKTDRYRGTMQKCKYTFTLCNVRSHVISSLPAKIQTAHKRKPPKSKLLFRKCGEMFYKISRDAHILHIVERKHMHNATVAILEISL